MEIIWVIIIIQAIACAGLSNFIAKQKGYDPTNWGLLGLFLGIIALIAVAGLPTLKYSQQENRILKNCPDCLETIITEAQVCRYCGCKFTKESILADFISKLNDGSETEKLHAINYIYEQQDTSTIPDVISYIENYFRSDHDDDFHIFKKAVAMLVKTKAEGLSEEFIRLLNHTKDTEKAKAYIKAIESLKDESAIPTILNHLDNHAGLKFEAQDCLIQFGSVAIPYLEKYAADGNKKTKKLVAAIIDHIQEK